MPFEGILYDKNTDLSVKCRLCAHLCTVRPGKRGRCQVRENREGTLFSLVYGRLVASNPDPVEKKPLYHFQPGTLSWSIATAGCNLSCSHCQNYHISFEAAKLDPIPGQSSTPMDVVQSAVESGCSSVCYTYTEPTVFMEFSRDCALEARKKGLANIFVTNGFMSPESAALAGNFLDAANIDLKAAREEHYQRVCGARLQPVLDTIGILYDAGVWIEITTLLIPGYNDDEDSLGFIAAFIASLDAGIPWHVSRFFPTYKLTDVQQTPQDTLSRAMEIGEREGLKYVYAGNISGIGSNTRCSSCGTTLIIRSGFSAEIINLDDVGTCLTCGEKLEGKIGKTSKRGNGEITPLA